MNKNEKKQKTQGNGKKKKKSFLSGLIRVEDEKEKKEEKAPQSKDQSKKNPQPPKNKEKLSEPNGLSEEEKLLLNTGEGVNLIPKKSKAEVQKEKKKFSFSITSMLSLLVLIVLSLGIVFFNIFSKQQLNAAKERLYTREMELEVFSDKIISNEEILDRIDLYKHLQQGVFSPKEILEYVLGVVNKAGNITIRTFDLGNNLDFEMNGSTTDLSVVAKLWYILGIDNNINTINLNSVGKGESGVSFSFEGELNTDKFIGK